MIEVALCLLVMLMLSPWLVLLGAWGVLMLYWLAQMLQDIWRELRR